MAEKNEKKDNLKHITLIPKKGQFVKPRGFGGSKFRAPPIKIDDFKVMINKLEDLKSIEVHNKKYIYFMIILTIEYHSSGVQDMLKRLNFNLISVLDDYRILVKGDKDILGRIREESDIKLNIRKYILEVKKLDDQEKIGESLQKLLKEDVDNTKGFSIILKTIDSDDIEENNKIRTELKEYLGSEYKFNANTGTFSGISNSKTIKGVSKLPFVRYLSLKPKAGISTDSQETLVEELKNFKIGKADEQYGNICILDTGINSTLFKDLIVKEDSYIYDDTNDILGHGTQVASVALFGIDLLNKNRILIPKCKLLNFKIAHDDPGNVDIEDALITAIERYKDSTFVFNLSYNYIDIDDRYRIMLAEKLDKAIQESNIIVVNSGGNLSLPEARNFISNYPDYLVKFPCFFPSEIKSIFSVGSICKTSLYDNIIISKFTRLTVTPLLINNEKDWGNYIKPDANTFGGDNLLEIERGRFKCYPDLEFPVITNSGKIVYGVGTSLAAPLMSQVFLKLKKMYNHFKNCETFKAILLNHCIIHNCNGQTMFSFLDFDNIGYCNDSIYLNYEGTTRPHQRKEDDNKKNVCECLTVEFEMPKEAKSVDIVAVHSNNYKFRNLIKQNTRLVIKVIKGNGKALKKHFGNLGQFSQVLYGTYAFNRNFEGIWKIQVYLETKGIPSKYVKDVLVRWGLSLKVNFGNIDSKNLREMYGILSGQKSQIVPETDEPIEIVHETVHEKEEEIHA